MARTFLILATKVSGRPYPRSSLAAAFDSFLKSFLYGAIILVLDGEHSGPSLGVTVAALRRMMLRFSYSHTCVFADNREIHVLSHSRLMHVLAVAMLGCSYGDRFV